MEQWSQGRGRRKGKGVGVKMYAVVGDAGWGDESCHIVRVYGNKAIASRVAVAMGAWIASRTRSERKSGRMWGEAEKEWWAKCPIADNQWMCLKWRVQEVEARP